MDEHVRATGRTMSNFGSAAQPRRGSASRAELERARSSIHAVTHGLRSTAVVMPGERIADRMRHAEAWHDSLRSTSPAEALIVNQIAEDDWKRSRLARAEHAAHLAALEEAMRKTPEHVSYSAALAALTAVNAMVHHAGATAALDPFPARLGIKPLALACRGAAKIVEEVEAVDRALVKSLDQALDGLEDAISDGKTRPQHLLAVHAAAQRIQADLVEIVARQEKSIEILREKLAAEVVPDGPDMKKLRRYRAEIEKSMSRLLGILGELRVQRQAAEAVLEASGAKAIDVRLRVVR